MEGGSGVMRNIYTVQIRTGFCFVGCSKVSLQWLKESFPVKQDHSSFISCFVS